MVCVFLEKKNLLGPDVSLLHPAAVDAEVVEQITDTDLQ